MPWFRSARYNHYEPRNTADRSRVNAVCVAASAVSAVVWCATYHTLGCVHCSVRRRTLLADARPSTGSQHEPEHEEMW